MQRCLTEDQLARLETLATEAGMTCGGGPAHSCAAGRRCAALTTIRVDSLTVGRQRRSPSRCLPILHDPPGEAIGA